MKKVRLLRRGVYPEPGRRAPLNGTRCVFRPLRAWPQEADSKNRAAISNVAVGLFQQTYCPEYFQLTHPLI